MPKKITIIALCLLFALKPVTIGIENSRSITATFVEEFHDPEYNDSNTPIGIPN